MVTKLKNLLENMSDEEFRKEWKEIKNLNLGGIGAEELIKTFSNSGNPSSQFKFIQNSINEFLNMKIRDSKAFAEKNILALAA